MFHQIVVERSLAVGDEVRKNEPVVLLCIFLLRELRPIFLCHLVESGVVSKIQRIKIVAKRLFVAFSFLISSRKSCERSFGRERKCQVLLKIRELFATDDALDDIPLSIENKKMGKSMNVVALSNGSILSFAHIHIERNEILVEIVCKFLVRKDIDVHTVAGDRPVSIAVEEDGLLLCFGARQSFIKGAHIVDFDVGFHFVAIHTGFYLSCNSQGCECAQSSGTSEE